MTVKPSTILILSLKVATILLLCWTSVGGGSRSTLTGRSFPVLTQAPITEDYMINLFGQDPYEFHQLAINESNLDDSAVSHKGARGKRQVMVGTARDLFGDWVTPKDLHEPLFNTFASLVELHRLQNYWYDAGYQDPLENKVLKYGSYYQGIRGVRTSGIILNYARAIIELKTRPETIYYRYREERIPVAQALKVVKRDLGPEEEGVSYASVE